MICGGCSFAKLCLTLCVPMKCSMPGFPVLQCLPEFAQVHVHWVSVAIQPSHPLPSPSPPAFSLFPASGSFPVSQLFVSGGQSIGASASASTLAMNIQDLFPLGLTDSGFLDSSVGKESACNVRDLVSIPGLGKSPRLEGKGYHSSILAWKSQWTHKELNTTEWLSLSA